MNTLLYKKKFVDDFGFRPAYSTINVTLTEMTCSDLRQGYCEKVDHAEYYFMHAYRPLMRHRVEEKKLTSIKKKKKVVKVVPRVCVEDWYELDHIAPHERNAVCVELVTEVSRTRQRKLRDRIHALFALYRDGCHTSLGLTPVSECEEVCDNSGGEDVVNEYDESRYLVEQGIEPNPGPTDPIDIPWPKDRQSCLVLAHKKGLFCQQNYMCGLNEFIQKHQAHMDMCINRVEFTPDHEPKFVCVILVTMEKAKYTASVTGKSKIESREKTAKNVLETIVAGEEHYLDVFPESHWIRDLLRECIESNPGPAVLSVPRMRFNDPSMRGIERAFAQMKLMDSFGKSISEFQNLNGTLNQLSQTVDNILPLLSANMTTTTSALLEIKDDVIKFGLIFILIQGLFLVGAKKTAICGCLLVLGKFMGFDTYLLSLFQKLIDKITRPRVEMKMEDFLYSDELNIVGKIIFGSMAFLCIKKIPGKQDWDNYIVRLSKIPQAASGGKKIWETCSEYFNVALDHVKMMCLGKTSRNFSVTSAYVQEIKDWMEEVSKCAQLDERQKVNHDEEFAKRVSALYIKGQVYSHDTTLPASLSRAIQNTLMPAYRLYQYVETAPSHGAGPKMRPVCLWLHGDSQIGKSTIVWAVCADMLNKMGYKDFKHLIYARQPETEFWDGYNTQPIVVYDDAFALRDDKTKPNPEVHEVIRTQNNFPQHVHMAALQDKNTYNKAQLVVYTSNEPNVSLESITFKDAFHNRMNDNCYKIYLKTQYAHVSQKPNGGAPSQRLNVKSIPAGTISTDIYEFQKQVRTDKGFVNVGSPISYEILRSRLVAEWREKRQSFSSHMEFLNSRMGEDWVEVADSHMKFGNLFKKEEESVLDNDEYHECVDTVAFVQDKIIELQNEGRDAMDIVSWFASSDETWCMWQQYQQSRLSQPSFGDRIRSAIQVCNEYLQGMASSLRDIVLKHPILSVLAFVGSAIAISASVGSLFSSDTSDMGVDEEETDEYEFPDGFIPQWYWEGRERPPHIENVETKDGWYTQGTAVEQLETAEYWDAKDRTIVELAHSGSNQVAKIPRARVQFLRNKTIASAMKVITRASVESCGDTNAHEIISGKVKKNSFRITVSVRDINLAGNVTFVKGKIFVMPYHFLCMMWAARVQLDDIVYLSQEENDRIISFPFSHLIKSFDEKTFHISENVVRYYRMGNACDLVFVDLHCTQSYPMCDISNLFVTQEQQALISKGTYSGAILTYEQGKVKGEKCLWRSYKWFAGIKSFDSDLELDFPSVLKLNPLRVRNFYKYEGISVPGDCGSAVAIYNKSLERKLIGIHNAGRVEGNARGVGYAVPLTCESIEEHCAQFRVAAHFSFEAPDGVRDEEVELPEGLFVPIGKSEAKVGQATKSALQPSRLYGHLLPVIKHRAPLVPFEFEGRLYDPMLEGLKKSGGRCVNLDNAVLKSITSVLLPQICNSHVTITERHFYERFLSYTEAVVGLNDDFMRPINRSTAPGFPWCMEKNKKPGKQSYLGSDEEYDAYPPNFKTQDGERVYTAVLELIDDCKHKKLRNVVSVDTKKDELRPNGKISTRIFAACPQHFVIAFRMHYLPFCAWIMHNRHHNGVAVGVNPFEAEWNVLAQLLQSKGSKVIAGDFSNFDGSLNSQILWAIFHDIFVPWVKYMHGEFSDDDYKICFGLWSHLCHSVHIFDDNVYMWTHSQPSGNPMTAILNSLYNLVVMRYSWHIIFEGTKYENQRCFGENVYMIAYGDDNVLNISSDVIDSFNQQTISDALLKIGHIYTDEAKTGEVVKYRPLSDVQFLKRSFVYHEELGRIVAPLDLKVIYEMLNWVRKSKSTICVDEVLATNVQVACREMVFHGSDEYELLSMRLKSLWHLFPKDWLPVVGDYRSTLKDAVNYPGEFFSFF